MTRNVDITIRINADTRLGDDEIRTLVYSALAPLYCIEIGEPQREYEVDPLDEPVEQPIVEPPAVPTKEPVPA